MRTLLPSADCADGLLLSHHNLELTNSLFQLSGISPESNFSVTTISILQRKAFHVQIRPYLG